MAKHKTSTVDLIILVVPNFNLSATISFVEPFRVSNYLKGRTLFRWKFVSVEGGNCIASNGASIDTERLSDIKGTPDMAMISSSWEPEKYYGPPIDTYLRKWARFGATLGSIETGAFILAAAGLLSGRRATTHNEHIPALRELYQDIKVVDNLFVFDKDRITCCGGSASLDCGLHIVGNVHSEVLANSAAHFLFHESLRPRGTRQPSEVADVTKLSLHHTRAMPKAVVEAIKIMKSNIEVPLPISSIVSQINVSQRHLGRLFVQSTQQSPVIYYRNIRLDIARGLVTQTYLPLSEIALATGFGSPTHFSRSYRQRYGISPGKDRIEGRIPFEFRAWPMCQM